MIETMRIGGLAVMHARPTTVRGPAVLFVHGILVDWQVWARWLPFCAERGLPAFALSLRGHGASGAVAKLGEVSMNDYIDDVAAVARHIGNPAVVGHSMGGLLAQCVAERGVVQSATLITPAPPRGIILFSPKLAINQIKYLPALFLNRPIVADLEELREIAMNMAPPETQKRALAQIVPESGRAMRQLSITGVPVDASKVRCPVQAFAAERDLFVPPKTVAKIAKRYHAPFTTIPGHGHIVIQEPGWESLAARVADWIETPLSS
ncbi:MAG TPA: alpha/beta hydrolase [Gemmatimonadaceae bacterium]|jgi:non-heme chloroperoxidase